MKSKILVTGIIGSFFFLTDLAYANVSFSGKTKIESCTVCHGLSGISPNPIVPNLAGQDAEYIVSQLKAFQSGSRNNETMKAISGSLSDIEMINLAAFYSTQDPEVMDTDAKLVEIGKEKFSLCWGCHGEKGEGPGSYPQIAGQHSQYTVQQLKNYKNGSRKNPAMNAISLHLSFEDMEALGAYIGNLNANNFRLLSAN